MSFSLQCTCRNFGACGFQVQKDREGIKVIKDGGRQKKNNNNNQKKTASWALLLSLLELITTFQQNYDNNRFVVMPRNEKQPILP